MTKIEKYIGNSKIKRLLFTSVNIDVPNIVSIFEKFNVKFDKSKLRFELHETDSENLAISYRVFSVRCYYNEMEVDLLTLFDDIGIGKEIMFIIPFKINTLYDYKEMSDFYQIIKTKFPEIEDKHIDKDILFAYAKMCNNRTASSQPFYKFGK